jgi:ABC-type antimicrobial peptide transport system permease subunit
MLRHTLLLIFRNYKRFKTTFFINLVGLSTGLACTLLIYLWVRDEFSVDKFFEKDDQLFQVMQNMHGENGIETIEATPGLLAQALAHEMPEVEYSAAVVPPAFNISKGTISIGETLMKTSGQYVSKDFFNVFSYQLIHGDKGRVLLDKNGVVISKDLALKLFKSVANAVGKSIEWNAQDIMGLYFISGVFESPPSNATNQFDILLNYDLFEEMHPDNGWADSSPRTFILLKEGTSGDQFNDKIKGFIKSKDNNSTASLFIQRYSDRYLQGSYKNGMPSGGRIEYVRLFSIIGFLILVIACINFMNLSTAKASSRIKAVGIKKAMGAGRQTLILQYLAESMFMAFLSLGVAILFVDLFMAQFSHITGKNLDRAFHGSFISSVLAITIIAGLLSGSYPALYLSRFKPASALKGKLNSYLDEVWTRKGLVIFQFAVSIILIVSVWVVYRQMEFVQSKSLGYKRDHVIYFNTEKMSQTIMTEIRKIPGVVNAGGGRLEAGASLGGSSADWEGKSRDNKTFFFGLWGSYGLIETLGMEMVAGRTFSEDFGSYDQIIFNEKAIESMGLKDPVGKTVRIRGQERQIVGVVKDFHFESLYETVKPCALLLAPVEYAPNVTARIQAGTSGATIQSLQRIHQLHNPAQPFDFKFMDDDYQRLYAAEQRVSVLTKYFAGLAILISCLGLFGLAAFTAERRMKEIGIRKVLGSSMLSIVYLLSNDFTKIILIAIIIAVPISYFITKHWLNTFVFRISLEWWYFIGAGIIALLIAWLTVGTQAFRAAGVNPVKCLKDE